MQRQVVDVIAGPLQDRTVPVAPRRAPLVLADLEVTSGDGLDRCVHAPHELHVALQLRGVVARVVVPDHRLVADPPVGDAVRPRMAVGCAHGREPGVAVVIAVLDPLGRLLGAAGADIHADVGLEADLPAEREVLVGAHRVGLRRGAPARAGVHQFPGPCRAGADAVLPVIGLARRPARPTKDSRPNLAQTRKHVAAEPAPVGDRRILAYPEAVVDRPSRVLEHHAVNMRMDPAARARGVDAYQSVHDPSASHFA